ncbi:MAG TPA: class IV adenylate cyclase [Anaerolineales bacterium]|nr:class IV adenylate cyclase [Anaerolineales bacterium]
MSKENKSSDQELEVKFFLSNHAKMADKLTVLGKVIAPRVHEVNLRLDTPNLDLLSAGKLLRLRQDTRARVTFKGTGSEQGGARLRQELEFTISDFDTALHLFEALGYQVVLMYEKYRTTFQLGNVEVAMDEMPTGYFLEIEGPDGSSIHNAADQLGLKWEARILDSYTMLFERTRQNLGFSFRDLSFENFRGLVVPPEAMGVKVGDKK